MPDKETNQQKLPSSAAEVRDLKKKLHRLGNRTVMPRLGFAQCMFLCAVDELGESAYVARIIEWFKKELGRPINDGQVYDIAKSLVALGYVRAQPPSPSAGAGRPIVVYSVTNKGRAGVRALTILVSDAVQREHVPEPREEREEKRKAHHARGGPEGRRPGRRANRDSDIPSATRATKSPH